MRGNFSTVYRKVSMKQLILGGARSGKSRLAEQLAKRHGDNICYIATTDRDLNDREMDDRIARHRADRPDHWQTIEEPLALGEVLLENDGDHDALLVDCLTLWLSNCFAREGEEYQQQKQEFLSALQSLSTPVLLVSNEVGLGVVPMGELSRRFVDEAGFLNQATAQYCDRVVFTAAGLPLVLKGAPLSL